MHYTHTPLDLVVQQRELNREIERQTVAAQAGKAESRKDVSETGKQLSWLDRLADMVRWPSTAR